MTREQDQGERPESEHSERPEAELFRDIVERAIVGVYAIQDDRFLYVNRGFANMLGVTPGDLLDLPSVMDIVLEEDRAMVRDQMKGRLERGEDSAHYFFRMRHADGSAIFVELYGTRVEVDGRPALAGTLLDITARRRAEAERERLIVELKSALEDIETLSGVVPICAWCRQVRDDEGYWDEVERFLESHTGATFTHGICPSCKAQVEDETSLPQ